MFRVTQVPSLPFSPFRVRDFHALRWSFPEPSATVSAGFVDGPTTPGGALPRPRFGLLRVRSPLLAQSLLFSLPPGTEMFQFPGFAPASSRCHGRPWRVAPFGNPRIEGYLPLTAAYRSLSRPSSPPRAQASFMCPSLLSFCFRLITRWLNRFADRYLGFFRPIARFFDSIYSVMFPVCQCTL